jgi:4-diphosphocytidyl-2-C-methyl-D-erythritol kinase
MNDNNEVLGLPEPWPAPAKLNLCLHIVGRRAEDGYHLLQSAMQLVDLCDELQFYRRPAGVIERIGENADIPAESDLIVRAASLLATRYEVFDGVGIEIKKRIPVQGGLGGGSSDAATVLVALNELWRLDLKIEQLATLGLALGADVPIFVRGHSAWVEGIGERLTPCDFPEQVFVVLKPQTGVSTAAVFQDPELIRDSPVTTLSDFFAEGGHNDCAPVVRKRSGEIAAALDWLGEFGDARLTGTGACVFVALPDDATARSVVARVPARWTAHVVHGLNRSPLLDRLAHESA